MAAVAVETETENPNSESFVVTDNGEDEVDKGSVVEKARMLIGALNLISRNLPLPPELLQAVSSIYNHSTTLLPPAAEDGDIGNDATVDVFESSSKMENVGNLMEQLEEAIEEHQFSRMSFAELRSLKESRFRSVINRRICDLQVLPSSRGDNLQTKCLLELYGLKLLELQKKIRSDLSAEYWLHRICAHPEKQLFDWGLMRIRYPFIMYGVGDSFVLDVDDRNRKKRYIERLSRLEEEEKNHVENRKKKFFLDITNMFRDFQVQAQTVSRRRKQRNDGVQAWHGRARLRTTRAEKLRFQALKADDQEAYMKMVEESKNERLKMLLGKTNELLVGLGAAVQRQKDAEHLDGLEVLKEYESEDPSQTSVSKSETPGDLDDDIEVTNSKSAKNNASNDLLEGQRQYHSTVHAIQEKVAKQPSSLQGGELRPYQLEGLQWMLSLFNNNLNGILADEMGLGKTIQTIALIAYLIEHKDVTGPHIIIAPKAVVPNWFSEFSVWTPSITVVLYDGRPEQRKILREEYFGEGKFNVLLTHYDLIMKDKKFLKKVHWYYMIVDEGHRLKNHDCALCQTIANGYRIRRRLLLTGTPIQNNLQELWSLLNFLLPTIFNSVENFEEWFNAPFACDVSLTDEEELLIIRRLHQVIRPFLLRRKKDEVEKYLPTKTQVILKCDLSAWQKAYYKQITDEGKIGHKSGKQMSLQNLSMHLRKCCNHPFLFVGDYSMWRRDQIIRASGKFELLDRLLPKLQRAGHRVLLFSQMTHLLDVLEIYLQMQGFKYLRLDGSSKTELRGELLKQFNAQNSPYFMFLLSTRAGGLGLNLQTADTVIIFDSDWNPQMDQQAEDRAHRIGQKKEVRVFVLVSVGSIEEEILERAKQKMGIDAKVIQAGLFNTTSTAQDRREMLQRIMNRGTSLLGTDVPSEREINRLAARDDEEFRLFEKMDEERRQREGYRPRLMEEHEVPDWVYARGDEDKNKGDNDWDTILSGRRRRKEVVYTDSLSDHQWMKAVEEGEAPAKLYSRRQRHTLPMAQHESGMNEQQNSHKIRKIEENSDENASNRPSGRSKTASSLHVEDESESEGVGEISATMWQNNMTWKTHKRKRSSHSYSLSTPDSNGRHGF